MKYYIQEQWRIVTDDGMVAFRDTREEAEGDEQFTEPFQIWSVFYGDGENDTLAADCYTVADAEKVRAALEYFSYLNADEEGMRQ